jgi:methyltransferase (TIGR00027 family)
MRASEASRTAVLVCQGRAIAQGAVATSRFDDPTAILLLRDEERAAVEQVRAGMPPRAWGPRLEFEMLRASAEVMVPRTVSIDDAVAARPTPQLVILGAGLDGRAWRMRALSSVQVFEVDHPASQEDKRLRAKDLQPTAKALRFVAVDFASDDLGAALASNGHLGSEATTWVWEGVIPYLGKAEVEATTRIVSERSALGSRLVIGYQAPNLPAALGRLAMRTFSVATARPDPLAHEPRRSAWTPAAMRRLLELYGWAVNADDDLVTLAEGMGLRVQNRRSLVAGRIVVADR